MVVAHAWLALARRCTARTHHRSLRGRFRYTWLRTVRQRGAGARLRQGSAVRFAGRRAYTHGTTARQALAFEAGHRLEHIARSQGGRGGLVWRSDVFLPAQGESEDEEEAQEALAAGSPHPWGAPRNHPAPLTTQAPGYALQPARAMPLSRPALHRGAQGQGQSSGSPSRRSLWRRPPEGLTSGISGPEGLEPGPTSQPSNRATGARRSEMTARPALVARRNTVDLRGLEPLTSALRTRRSPS